MIAARYPSVCPGCSKPIQVGDLIGPLGLAHHCAACVRAFAEHVESLPEPTYPISGTYEPC